MTIDVTTLYDRRADNRWDRIAVGDILERVAQVRPDAEAFVAGPGASADPRFARLTYAQAEAWANRFANALLARGLPRGGRVLMICDNSVEGFIAKIGVAKAGGVVVPVNPRQVVSFLHHAIALTDPWLVVADSEHLALPQEAGVPVDLVIPIGDRVHDTRDFLAFCEESSAEPPELSLHGDDIWQILFTSGTTAMPKGVMLSHIYSYMTALSWAPAHTRGLPHESRLRTVCFAPVMFHVGDQGYVMPALFCGGTVILGRTLRPALVATAVVAEKATLICTGNRYLALQTLAELEARGPGAASSLTCVMHATGLLTAQEVKRFEALSPGLSVTYLAGQTESVTSHRFVYDAFPVRHAEAVAGHLNLVGMPTPLLASCCVDPEDGLTPVPHGAIGELVYRSPATTAGYYRDPESTERAFAHGWFHSGDLGMTDAAGHRVMTGRIKDMIKTGGENVASTRVEAVVQLHPSVAQVAVIGLPDPRWSEIVVAVVVLEDGAAFDERAIIAFCRERLPGHETPKRVVAVDTFPTGFGGKIEKQRLKDQLLARELPAGRAG